jgi:hypothetical protein
LPHVVERKNKHFNELQLKSILILWVNLFANAVEHLYIFMRYE